MYVLILVEQQARPSFARPVTSSWPLHHRCCSAVSGWQQHRDVAYEKGMRCINGLARFVFILIGWLVPTSHRTSANKNCDFKF